MLFEYNVGTNHRISHGNNFTYDKVTEHVNVDGNNKQLYAICKYIFDCPSHIQVRIRTCTYNVEAIYYSNDKRIFITLFT